MPTVEITKDNFEATVEKGGMVLIDWWAEWCGPCRMFGPVFEKASQANPDIVFGKVNTEEQPELAAAFNIMSIPTLMVFRDQIVLYAQPGALPAHVLDALIDKVRALDMDQVRKEIEAREAEGGRPERDPDHDPHGRDRDPDEGDEPKRR